MRVATTLPASVIPKVASKVCSHLGFSIGNPRELALEPGHEYGASKAPILFKKVKQ